MDEAGLEEKLNSMNETLIRMEAYLKEVDKLRKWKEGNGLPGAQFQLWTLWCVFMVITGILIRRVW